MRILVVFNIICVALIAAVLGGILFRVGKVRGIYDPKSAEILGNSSVLKVVDEVSEIALFYDREGMGPAVVDLREAEPVMVFREREEIALFVAALERGMRDVAEPPLEGRGVLSFLVRFKEEGRKPALMHGMLAGPHLCEVLPFVGGGTWDTPWIKAYSLFRFLKERGLPEAVQKAGGKLR